MSHNFMLRDMVEKQTKGVFKIKHENAYRYAEYGAIAAYFLTDILFVFSFLQ